MEMVEITFLCVLEIKEKKSLHEKQYLDDRKKKPMHSQLF